MSRHSQDTPAPMLIANPLYDTVFKYMMEDNKVAKLFLSALLGQEILELSFLPQELSAEAGTDSSADAGPRGSTKKASERRSRSIRETTGLSIYRLDFSARLRTDSGERQVIIELQKSKLRGDDLRFRRYLGKQYMNMKLFRFVASRQEYYKQGIPIFPIFILGEGLESFEEVPVVMVENCLYDRHTEEPLEAGDAFVDSLFHKGLIVNVPALKQRRRDELERVLSVFDQELQHRSFHILNVHEEDFPEQYRPIIRRLQSAVESEEVRDWMNLEDEYLQEWNEVERELLEERANREKAEEKAQEAERQAREAERQVQEAMRREKEVERQAQEAERREKEAERQAREAEKREQEMQRLMAKALQEAGMDLQGIAQKMGIGEEDVERLLEG